MQPFSFRLFLCLFFFSPKFEDPLTSRQIKINVLTSPVSLLQSKQTTALTAFLPSRRQTRSAQSARRGGNALPWRPDLGQTPSPRWQLKAATGEGNSSSSLLRVLKNKQTDGRCISWLCCARIEGSRRAHTLADDRREFADTLQARSASRRHEKQNTIKKGFRTSFLSLATTSKHQGRVRSCVVGHRVQVARGRVGGDFLRQHNTSVRNTEPAKRGLHFRRNR